MPSTIYNLPDRTNEVPSTTGFSYSQGTPFRVSYWQSRLLWSVILLALGAGCVFRLIPFERKVFWYDEVLTVCELCGHSYPQIFRELQENHLLDGHPASIWELRKYITASPSGGKGLCDAVRVLAEQDPTNLPLHPVLCRLWMESFGSDVATIRLLSGFISLLLFPAAYWLARELFNSSIAGALAMALFAVSPYQIWYAHEIRQYALWFVVLLASNAAFLHACRQQTWLPWISYALICAAAFYVHLLTALVILTHGIYLLAIEKFRLSKTAISFCCSVAFALLAFLPWALASLPRWQQEASDLNFLSRATPLPDLVLGGWVRNLTYPFAFPNSNDVASTILVLLILSLEAYALFYLRRHLSGRQVAFAVAITLFPFLALAVPDVMSGGTRSAQARYLAPTLLMCTMLVAFVLSDKLSQKHRLGKIAWSAVTVLLLAVGCMACWNMAQEPLIAGDGDEFEPLVPVIEKASKPLLIVDHVMDWTNWPTLLFLSSRLDSSVQIELLKDGSQPVIPAGFNDVFFYDRIQWDTGQPSRFAQLSDLEPVEGIVGFWKLKERRAAVSHAYGMNAEIGK